MKTLDELKNDIDKIKHRRAAKTIVKSHVPLSFKVCAEIFSGIFTGMIIGRILDKLFNENYIFTIISLTLGCIASFRVLYQLMTKR